MNELIYITDKAKTTPDELLKPALNVFKWQFTNQDRVNSTNNISEATYIICTWYDYLSIPEVFKIRTQEHRYYIIFYNESEFREAMISVNPTKPYQWSRLRQKGFGWYEVTSKGDKRFSPFFMKTIDFEKGLITLEDYWKYYIKPLPLEQKRGTAHKIFTKYLKEHSGLFYELAIIGKYNLLTDMFDVNGGQNLTYCDLLNKYYGL